MVVNIFAIFILLFLTGFSSLCKTADSQEAVPVPQSTFLLSFQTVPLYIQTAAQRPSHFHF